MGSTGTEPGDRSAAVRLPPALRAVLRGIRLGLSLPLRADYQAQVQRPWLGFVGHGMVCATWLRLYDSA